MKHISFWCLGLYLIFSVRRYMEITVDYSKSRSIKKMLTQNCGCVGVTYKFMNRDTVFASLVMICLYIDNRTTNFITMFFNTYINGLVFSFLRPHLLLKRLHYKDVWGDLIPLTMFPFITTSRRPLCHGVYMPFGQYTCFVQFYDFGRVLENALNSANLFCQFIEI